MSNIESTRDGLATDLARSQHGLITLQQARRFGLSKSNVAGRVLGGTWRELHRGVFVVGGAPDTYEQRLLGRLLFCGPDAVASHAAAAKLWGIPGFGHRIEWTRPRGRSQRRSYGWCHGSLWLPSRHVGSLGGIPVTTTARTVFDLAGVVHPGRTERAMDTALSRKLCTFGDLATVFADLARRGRRGTVVMRALLDARSAGYIPPNSELEALARSILLGAGLTGFEVETDLGDGAWIGRVDLLFREARVVVELDGRRFHQALLDADADRARDNRLMAQGWRVLRFTWDDLRERPDVFLSQLRRALAMPKAS